MHRTVKSSCLHTIPYHIPSSRSERARQGGFCFLSIVTVARRRNRSSDLPDVCVAFSGGLVMGEQNNDLRAHVRGTVDH
eukprot:s2176_g10.t1